MDLGSLEKEMIAMEKNRRMMRMVTRLVIMLAAVTSVIGIMGCSINMSRNKTVGKDIKESDFDKFYYTYSSTAYPPQFQRYLFYMEDGKPMFYHEQREGDKVFLTEEDVTVSGTMELTTDEWNRFWDYINGGTVKNREENISTGGSGPWLYLYWQGDKGKCQQFSFVDYGTEVEFEEFCKELKEKFLVNQ